MKIIMKKILLSAFALMMMSEVAIAQKVSVADVYAMPGQTVSFSVDFEGKAEYSALTLYANFPTTGFSTTGEYTVNSAWKGATAVVGDINTEGVATIPFASANGIESTAVNGLVTVEFTVADDVTEGDYDVTLKGTMFQYYEGSNGYKEYAPDVTFKVKVSNMAILDENSTVAPSATVAAVDIKVLRTIKANEWSTICLPFPMSAEKWKSAFGADAEIHKFSSYEKDGDVIKVIFANKLTAAMAACTPYIIKTSRDISEFEVNAKITLTPNNLKTVYSYDDEESGETIDAGYMQGVLQAGSVVAEDNLFLNSGKFWYSTGKTVSKGFRANFWFMDKATDESRFVISFDDATGINSVRVAADSDKVFDLQGRQIEAPAKGVYIKGGKKVVIK